MLSVSDNKHGSGAGYGVTGDAYPNNVSVNNIPTTAGAPDPAMVAAAAAAGLVGVTARLESPLGTMVNDDFEISEDSFTQTPSPLKKETLKTLKRDPPRQRVASRKRGSVPLGRTARAASVGAAGARGLQRPPSPAIDVAPNELMHQLMAPTGTSGEERLDALERQQKHDHVHFQNVGRLMQNVLKVMEHQSHKVKDAQQASDEYVQMGLTLRREIYSVRDKLEAELRSAGGIIETRLPAVIEQAATGLTARIAATETLLEQLKNSNAKHAEYLNELHAARPKEGQAVVDGFQQVTQEVGRVKDLISQIEGKAATQNIFPQDSTTLTKEMMDALTDMYLKVNSMAQLYNSYGVMCQKVEQNALLSEALSTSCAEFVRRLDALDKHVPNDSGVAAWQAGTCGGALNAGASAWNPGHGAPCCPPGMPSSSGDGGDNARINAIVGGNGICHCIHVKELMGKVDVMEAQMRHMGSTDPWQRATAHAVPSSAPGPMAHAGSPTAGTSPEPDALPLKLHGPLGAIGFKDRSMFDDKLTMQEEFRFHGTKNGPQWKGRIRRYFISKAPVLKLLLEWAERQDRENIDLDFLKRAVGTFMTEDQLLNMNAAIWGFLSGALHGTAETIFKRAEDLNGIEAWRRIVRFIDHGREIRLETLRREVKMLHLKPIREIEGVEEGVAEFENTIREYEQAGGTAFQDGELKSDLLAILPAGLRENLLWQASDTGNFQKFRDMVVAQAAKVTLNRRKMAVHHVQEEQPAEEESISDILANNAGSTVEEIIAALQRYGRNGVRRPTGPRTATREDRRDRTATREDRRDDRPPRKCPNCGKVHADRKCPEPPVPLEKRKCWGCGEAGHTSAECPLKKGKPLKALEDGPIPFFGHVGMVLDEDGFQTVRKGARPQPRPATLGDFVDANTFNAISECNTAPRSTWKSQTTPTSESREHGASRLMRHPKPKLPAKNHCATVGSKKGELRVMSHEDKIIGDALMNIEEAVQQEMKAEDKKLALILEEHEELVGAATEVVKVRVAMDSGSVANVINSEELPSDAQLEANNSGSHFVGAGGGRIRKYGACNTSLKGKHGQVGCRWQVADVTMALNSVSTVTGPYEGPGDQDVLFNNKTCYVVPPGVVAQIMKHVKAVAEYPRDGGLYVADMELTSFQRQGQGA